MPAQGDNDDNTALDDESEPGSVFEVDDEQAGRESFLGDPPDLAAAEARMEFADDVSTVDADPLAKDAAVAGASSTPFSTEAAKRHLRGLLEALLFVTDRPIKAADLADVARAETKEVRALLEELSASYKAEGRGFVLDELAGGWQMRTAAPFAPFVREMTARKPVKLSRAQVETLAIVAYRQPVTRPEIEDVRGVDAGAVLKLLLERDLVRVLGKKDEPGRPLLYGTTNTFLTFFGLKSLRDLPTLREFTELSEESRDVVERELGEVLPEGPKEPAIVGDANLAGVEDDPTDAKPQSMELPTSGSGASGGESAPIEGANDGLEEDRPGGKSYDPKDEELYPDDDDSDFDDEDEDDEEDEEDEDEEDDEAEK